MQTAGEHVAFFSCQPDTRTEKTKALSIVSSVVSQILNWKLEILHRRDVEFRRIVSEAEYHGSSSSEHDLILRGRVSLLNAVLSDMKGIGIIYLVLDRIDQCKTPINNLMNELSRLLVLSPVTVKVAVVVETSSGNGDWDPKNTSPQELCHRVKDCLFLRKNWNQQPLTYQEGNRHDRHRTWDSG